MTFSDYPVEDKNKINNPDYSKYTNKRKNEENETLDDIEGVSESPELDIDDIDKMEDLYSGEESAVDSKDSQSSSISYTKEELIDIVEKIKKNIKEWVCENLSETFVFRPYQLDAIVRIIFSIVYVPKKTSIVEAPTGSGKSLICIISAGVLAKYYKKSSYILASDLYLWKQYMDAIDSYRLNDFGYLKGSIGNYHCDVNHMDYTLGKCKIQKVSLNNLRNREWRNANGFRCVGTCEYMKQRFRAEKTPVTLLTYHLWLYQMNLVDHSEESAGFKPRDVIFCDECHNIPDIVQKYAQPIVEVEQDKGRLMDILQYAIDNNVVPKRLYVDCMRPDTAGDIFRAADGGVETLSDECRNDIRHQLRMEDVMCNYEYFIDCLGVLDRFDDGSGEVKVTILKDYLNLLYWFDELCKLIGEDETLTDSSGKGKPSKEEIRIHQLLSWFHNYYSMISEFVRACSDAGSDYMIVERTEDRMTGKVSYLFSCAKEDYLCYQFLLKHSKFNVMTSATIGNKQCFADNIGVKYINEGEIIWSSIPNTFDFSKSPIYYLPNFKMSYERKKYDFPEIMKVLYKIMQSEAFKDKRGMINTGSYENAKMIFDKAPKEIKERLCLYNNSKDKNEQIKLFKMGTNKVMIGPTLVEGVDLPGDLCRFILIVKVPYPSIASKLIKAKMNLFPLWYDSTTSNTIIQNIGRGVRNEKDWCTTFILDGCFGWLYQKTMEQYPVEIRQRIRQINNI